MKSFKEFVIENSNIPDVINSKPTRNNLGQLIHPTLEGIKNFWEWFEDSKIKDEKNRPIVVFHGTAQDVLEFKSFVNWFSINSEFAAAYADIKDLRQGFGANVIPCYIKSIRPFDADKLTKGSNSIAYFVTEMADQAEENGTTYNDDEILSIIKKLKDYAKNEESGPHYRPHDFWFNYYSLFGSKGGELIEKLFEIFEFDSIHFTEDGEQTYGILKSTHIKSAIGNNGKFSDSKNITENLNDR